ncbi:Nsp1-like C-terminal region-domain-containing protein [Endogone sp. FLAS-F59071]|nr:Nsp1-like C-terminal region-domain-containing protein [Endogone sp. FLAS-F59071]|eukprot:RUS19190.1 Nsp1-like C-terminal region-domain-containing protein [Endogone sp. FLAS-F59071]
MSTGFSGFGSNNPTAPPTTGFSFGSGAAPTNTSTTPQPTTGFSFGSASAAPTNTSTTPQPTTGFSLGGGNNWNSSNTTQSNPTGASQPSFSFGNTPTKLATATTTATTTTPSLFSSGGFSFGGSGAPAPAGGGGLFSTQQTGSALPTSNQIPPGTAPNPLMWNQSQQTTTGASTISAQAQASAPASATGFSGFGLGGSAASSTASIQFPKLIGNRTAATTTAATASDNLFGRGYTSSTGLFGSAPTPSTTAPVSSSLFGSNTTAPSSNNFFGAAATSTTAPSSTSLFGASTTSTTAPPSTSLFGASTTSTAAPPSTNLFGASTTSTTAPSTSLFGASTTSTTAPSSTSLFGTSSTNTLGSGLKLTTTSMTPPTTATTAATTTTAAAAPSLTTTTAAAPALTTTPATPATSASASASVSAPVPSSLKNKTMEDIVNKWTTDLNTYTREFHRQAAEVAEWDMVLITNGNKISKLYAEVLQAEGAQSTIDHNLDYIEQQQQELANVLEEYEGHIRGIFDQSSSNAGQSGVGGPEGTQPADEEREKAYDLAESLNKQLDEMGKGLGVMIEEINKMGGPSGGGTGGDEDGEDAVAQIVKILNAHLTSLQWIDNTSMSLQQKVQDVARLQEMAAREQELLRMRRGNVL